jgi:hypothetical protein
MVKLTRVRFFAGLEIDDAFVSSSSPCARPLKERVEPPTVKKLGSIDRSGADCD